MKLGETRLSVVKPRLLGLRKPEKRRGSASGAGFKSAPVNFHDFAEFARGTSWRAWFSAKGFGQPRSHSTLE